MTPPVRPSARPESCAATAYCGGARPSRMAACSRLYSACAVQTMVACGEVANHEQSQVFDQQTLKTRAAPRQGRHCGCSGRGMPVLPPYSMVRTKTDSRTYDCSAKIFSRRRGSAYNKKQAARRSGPEREVGSARSADRAPAMCRTRTQPCHVPLAAPKAVPLLLETAWRWGMVALSGSLERPPSMVPVAQPTARPARVLAPQPSTHPAKHFRACRHAAELDSAAEHGQRHNQHLGRSIAVDPGKHREQGNARRDSHHSRGCGPRPAAAVIAHESCGVPPARRLVPPNSTRGLLSPRWAGCGR